MNAYFSESYAYQMNQYITNNENDHEKLAV